MRFKDLSASERLRLYQTMLLSRTFEEAVNDLFMKGLIHGTTHLGIGQEAGHSALSAALSQGDYILPTHRGHGHFLGRGGSPEALMHELFGNRYGSNAGLGGSMHLIDLANNNMGSSGVVAGAVPLGVGMAMALKKRGSDSIVAVLLGDGAMNQGMAMESINLSAVWQVPLLFFCENNQYAMSSSVERFAAGGGFAERAASFAVASKVIDGNDLGEVYDGVCEAREAITSSSRPYFIESKTYRWLGHSKSDNRLYRTREEEAAWKQRDPIARERRELIASHIALEDELDRIAEAVRERIKACVEDAMAKKDDILTIDEAIGLVLPSVGNEERP